MTKGRELWRAARTLEDLGGLGAQWLEGGITFLPAYFGDGPAPETKGLVHHLAAANRAGYFTISSQPGVPLVRGNGQRAYVWGFADEATTDAVQAALLGTRLVALANPPGRDTALSIPVTTMDVGLPCTWAGSTYSPADIIAFYADDVPEAVESLLNAWQLTVFDPEWGDNSLLWEKLAEAWA